MDIAKTGAAEKSMETEVTMIAMLHPVFAAQVPRRLNPNADGRCCNRPALRGVVNLSLSLFGGVGVLS